MVRSGPTSGTLTPEVVAGIRATLQRAILRFCPRWLTEDREELVQGATLQVIETWRRGEKREAPDHSYLMRVAFTTIAGAIRRRRRERFVPLDDSYVMDETPRSNPEMTHDASKITAAIRDCVRQMPEDRRQAVILWLHGYGRQESARVLGWPLKRVDNCRHRGLEDLRRCLSDKGYVR